MIIHKLIHRHLTHGDDDAFYSMQAEDALRWIKNHIHVGDGVRVLDLGCGCGILGEAFENDGCNVTYSDTHHSLRERMTGKRFVVAKVGEDDLSSLGEFDIVLFSNVLEHLPDHRKFIVEARNLIKPGGVLFLSWTNWLSPWGGHDFSPLHYLGPKIGPAIYDAIRPGKRQHFPFAGLWPVHIGPTMNLIRGTTGLRILAAAPRYYTELGFIMRIPVVREFLAWNAALIIQRISQ